jgi:hypothetical protein
MEGEGGVKKCFLILWQTALLSEEGKKSDNTDYTQREVYFQINKCYNL